MEYDKLEKKIDEIAKTVFSIANKMSSIETTLIEREKSEILRNQILEKTVISNSARIEKLESKFTWVIRTVIGAVIGAVIALLIKFGGTI